MLVNINHVKIIFTAGIIALIESYGKIVQLTTLTSTHTKPPKSTGQQTATAYPTVTLVWSVISSYN